MVTAYLLMNVKPGSETNIAADLVKKKEVEDINIVYGAHDVIMKVRVKTMDELQRFILDMRKDKAIEQTTTLISTSAR